MFFTSTWLLILTVNSETRTSRATVDKDDQKFSSGKKIDVALAVSTCLVSCPPPPVGSALFTTSLQVALF